MSWCELAPLRPVPAGPLRGVDPPGLVDALVAAVSGVLLPAGPVLRRGACRGERRAPALTVLLVAEPNRLAVLVDGDAPATRLLGAGPGAPAIRPCARVWTAPLPPHRADAHWVPGPLDVPLPPETRCGQGRLLQVLDAVAAGTGEAAAVRVRLWPARPADRARLLALARQPERLAATGADSWPVRAVLAVLAGVSGATGAVLDVLPGAAGPGRPGAAQGVAARPVPPDLAVRAREAAARAGAPLLRAAVDLSWWAGEPARAGERVQAAGAAGGLPVRRAGRPPVVAVAAGDLLGLLEPGPDLVVLPFLARAPRTDRPAMPAPAAPAGTVPLGRTAAGRVFGLTPAALAGHAYLLGPSGTGKTTLLARLVTGLALSGTAAVVLDPHGDLVRQVLTALPDRALRRAQVLDLGDPAHLPTLNPLWVPRGADPAADAVARAVRSAAVTAVFADLWNLHRAATPNLLHFLEAALAALVGCGGGCLADLPRFLTDGSFRAEVVRGNADDRIRRRWAEFAGLRPDDRSRTVRAIVNKAGEFDRNPVLGTVFGDPGPGLRLAEVMDNRGLLLVHLPRGLVPEGTVELLGSVLVTLLHQEALAREARPPAERPLCVAVIDEFQEFALRTFAQVVTSTRKYGLGLVVANQNLSRISAVDPDVLATLLANVATLGTFRPGAADAAVLAPQFAPYGAADLLDLPPRCCLWRLAGGGDPRTVLSAVALPPAPATRSAAEVAGLLRALARTLPGSALRLTPPAGQEPQW